MYLYFSLSIGFIRLWYFIIIIWLLSFLFFVTGESVHRFNSMDSILWEALSQIWTYENGYLNTYQLPHVQYNWASQVWYVEFNVNLYILAGTIKRNITLQLCINSISHILSRNWGMARCVYLSRLTHYSGVIQIRFHFQNLK